MRIRIYVNKNKDPDGIAYKAVCDAAAANGVTVCGDGERCDLVVSIGGDGTILRMAKDCARDGVPILGVNLGTVGFLTETELGELDSAFKRLISRDYTFERRALLDVTVGGKHYYALNDAVVQRSAGGRVIHIGVTVGGERLDSVRCDGYIVSTPTGSTAYSLSAGGPIVAPDTGAITLTPISPHDLRTRSMVVSSGSKVELEYIGELGAALYIDGDTAVELKSGDKVNVTGWDMSALFVRFGKKSFYSRLLDKLSAK